VIAENTAKWRLDLDAHECRLCKKETTEEIKFTGRHIEALHRAISVDLAKHPNGTLDQRLGRVWKRFEAKSQTFDGHDFTSGHDGVRIKREMIDVSKPGDYGADPLGDGRFKMVPSGDIVDFEERTRRLKGRSR
jgi:hypothetical protein